MKFRNLLCNILVVSMLFSSFATAFAYSVPENYAVKIETKQYTEDEIKSILGDNAVIPEGQGYFNIAISFNNLGELSRKNVGTNRSPIYEGVGVTKLETKIIAETGNAITLDYKGDSTIPDLSGIANSSEYNGIQCLYNGMSAETFLPKAETTTYTDINNAFVIDVWATLGGEITFNTTARIDEFTNNALAGTDALYPNASTQTIKLGASETKEFDDVDSSKQAVTAGADAEDKYVANSKGETKFLKHIATILTSAKANKKVRINKLNANGAVESYQQSGRTLGEILGGVATPETTISGKIAVGVMTTNNSDVFSFELVD